MLALNKNVQNQTNQDIEERDWIDGSIIFNDSKLNGNGENNFDRRLTFNIDKNSTNSNTHDKMKSRETYEIAPKNINATVELSPKFSRTTFEVPQKESVLLDMTNSRATYDIPKNEKKIFEQVLNEININDVKIKTDKIAKVSIKNDAKEIEKKKNLGKKFDENVLVANKKRNLQFVKKKLALF